jgi:hypothetical protein
MSRRHRQSEKHAGLSKEDRLAEHRRARRAARQKIDVVEPDAAVLPGEGPAHLHAHRPTAREKSRPRHWKLPFWKRRRAARAQKAEAERRLADEE